MSAPPKGDDALNKHITIPMTRAMFDRLAMEAEKQGRSKTVFARMLILSGIGLTEKIDG